MFRIFIELCFVQVTGRNPGYGFTATALLLAGITILKESDKMPGK